MNYHFKSNNIYYGNILVADDMRDATKRLNDLEEMFGEELKILREHHRPVWKIDVVLSRYAMFEHRNSDEFKLIRSIANELGVKFDYIDYPCSSLHVYETDYQQASKVILNV